MRELRSKHTKHKLLIPIQRWGVVVLLCVVLLFMLQATWGMYRKAYVTNVSRSEVATAHASLIEKKERLHSAIAYLETDRGIEDEIRKRFRVVKEGEHMVILVDPKVRATDEVTPISLPWWKRLWNRF